MRATYSAHLIFLDLITLLREVRIMNFHTVQLSPAPCYFVPHRPKYLNQHPTPKHSQPMFFPYVRYKVSHLYITAATLQANILIFMSFRQQIERRKF